MLSPEAEPAAPEEELRAVQGVGVALAVAGELLPPEWRQVWGVELLTARLLQVPILRHNLPKEELLQVLLRLLQLLITVVSAYCLLMLSLRY